MEKIFAGKKVLFFGPETFNYEKEIVAELERLGAQVVYRSDKPSKSFALKAILRLFPRIVQGYSDRVFFHWLADHAPGECDVVLVIKGEGLSSRFIDALKDKYEGAKFVFYLWDSIKNVRDTEQKLSRFDHLYSFDRGDCSKYMQFKYRPLFFLERYRLATSSSASGFFFIGTLNGDRPAVISRIIRAFPKGVDFNYWLFVRNNTELFFRKFFDPALRSLDGSRLLRVPMPGDVIGENFRRSAAILDIEHPNQVGLTMRTFEVLAAGKKLITTNQSISDHDFFHPSRICIVDRHNPVIDPEFVHSRFEMLPPSFYEKYSLRGWLLEILECVAIKGGS